MATNQGTARDRLIETTRRLLWERGYAATSPGAILAESGVGQGSMYHHFAGKEELAAEALAVTSGELIGGVETLLSWEGTAFERLRAYLERQRDVMRGCPVGRMAGDADVLGSEALHAVVGSTFERIRGRMVDVIEEGVASGELDADVRPDELADAILAVVQGGYVLARAAGETAPFDRAVNGAIGLLDRARAEERR